MGGTVEARVNQPFLVVRCKIKEEIYCGVWHVVM